MPEVVAWARGLLLAIHGTSLDDKRVSIRIGDIGAAIASGPRFDAILLDVDNGPDGLSRPANDRLYNGPKTRAKRRAKARRANLKDRDAL